MRPRLEQDDIHQLADRIWDSMFGAGLELIDAEAPTADLRFLTGCVQLTGAWEGAAVVAMLPQARLVPRLHHVWSGGARG